MVKAVLFDLFETLITESATRPPGVSSLAPELGCERQAFRKQWSALRPSVTVGRVSFGHALSGIATGLRGHADDVALKRLCDRRIRVKAEPFAHIQDQILTTIDSLRSRDLRLGVISNCFAEDVVAWPQCSLAPRFDCTVFSCEVGLAKPDREIYLEATRRLRVDASETWYIGDGADDELSGAVAAGLRAFKALWFLRRWPHFREERGVAPSLNTVEEVMSLVGQAAGPSV
jgi:phosphoglycolate phosphatase-like HAD superfamily hydrolase